VTGELVNRRAANLCTAILLAAIAAGFFIGIIYRFWAK
jgi:hypothetical protein